MRGGFVGARGSARFRRRALARSAEAGFTLVEMLVVLAIIGLIVGLVGPRVLGYLGDSKIKAAKIQIDGFGAALDLFYLDNGRYPTTSEGIGALMQKPANASSWNGPYLKATGVPKDPWGNAYVYHSPSQYGPYDISSLGPDGREGANNVTSWAR
jgi:general secretion pathway protein G